MRRVSPGAGDHDVHLEQRPSGDAIRRAGGAAHDQRLLIPSNPSALGSGLLSGCIAADRKAGL